VVEAVRDLIWYGGLLIALGGVLALIGRVAGRCARGSPRKIAERRAELEAMGAPTPVPA
jgi:cytochrome c-type biogenesis protein CcmF